MKSVLMSIRPKWCELEVKGIKTIEVRKTKPKLDTPLKVYIYCTKAKKGWFNMLHMSRLDGKVIGEFVCDYIRCFDVPYPAFQNQLDKSILEQSCCTYYMLHRYAYHDALYGWHISDLKIYDKPKELSEFHKCDIDIQQIDEMGDDLCKYCKATDYGDHKFCSTPNGPIFCEGAYCGEAYDEYRDQLYDENSLTRPPQSWCYVEGEE